MGGARQPGSARAPTWWPARACRHPERAGDSGADWLGIATRKPRQAGLDERFNGPLCGELLNETLFRWRPMPAPTWSSVRVRTRLRPGHSLGRAGKRGASPSASPCRRCRWRVRAKPHPARPGRGEAAVPQRSRPGPEVASAGLASRARCLSRRRTGRGSRAPEACQAEASRPDSRAGSAARKAVSTRLTSAA